jgi:hypothetical protein
VCALGAVGWLVISGCGAGQIPATRTLSPSVSTATGPTGPLPPTIQPSPATGGAPGSTVVGHYFESERPGASARPVGGGTVGLYREAFQPGTNAKTDPPIASASVGADGRFRVEHVPSGTWFLARDDLAIVTYGRWVMVTETEGVAVDLYGCLTCPPRA